MPTLSGYTGELLFVDLTKGTATRKPINWDYARDFIGGCGYSVRLLYDRLPLEQLDPLHPDNEVAIFVGPLTATGAPCTGRHSVCTKSALTGIWGESTGGGYFGAELKSAGLDGILITGAASSPVYLVIDNDTAKLESAAHLWGRNTFETEKIIKRDTSLDKVRILSIGPAGENRVRFAAVMNDSGRASARAGAGAVLGAKQLKAIAVRGTQKVALADPDKFREHAKEAAQNLQGLAPILGAFGTLSSADMLMNLFNDMPVRYFTEASMDISKINAMALKQYRVGQSRCHICPIGCGPIVTVDTDKVKLKEVSGPEYETVGAMGTQCQIDDLPMLVKASHLCDSYGLDTISCGGAIAFAMAAHEKGKIPDELLGGLDLSFGNADTLVQLVEMIAHRQGLGDLLAEGTRRAGDRLAIPELALHVKGLEIPMHDPRAFFGMATTYATSPTGANHMQGGILTVTMGVEIPELGLEPQDRHEDKGKGVAVAKFQSWRTLYNSLTVCKLAMLGPPLLTALYNTVTGRNMTPLDLYEIGRRIITMTRAFNIRCGVTAKDDTLPAQLTTPLGSGANAGKAPNLQVQLKEFYQYHKWDPASGKPTHEALTALGLHDVAEDLWSET